MIFFLFFGLVLCHPPSPPGQQIKIPGPVFPIYSESIPAHHMPDSPQAISSSDVTLLSGTNSTNQDLKNQPEKQIIEQKPQEIENEVKNATKPANSTATNVTAPFAPTNTTRAFRPTNTTPFRPTNGLQTLQVFPALNSPLMGMNNMLF